MRLSGIATGDLVAVDRKGRVFVALVDGVHRGELGITPLRGAGVTYRTATAREVIAHYRRRGDVPSRHVLVGPVQRATTGPAGVRRLGPPIRNRTSASGPPA